MFTAACLLELVVGKERREKREERKRGGREGMQWVYKKKERGNFNWSHLVTSGIDFFVRHT